MNSNSYAYVTVMIADTERKLQRLVGKLNEE